MCDAFVVGVMIIVVVVSVLQMIAAAAANGTSPQSAVAAAFVNAFDRRECIDRWQVQVFVR